MRKPAVFSFLCFLCLMVSCKKNILDNTGSSVGFADGGLSNFNEAAISYNGDTTVVDFSVVLYPSTIKENLTVSIGINDAARVAYNNSGATLLYDSLPDSCYSLSMQSAVIKSGSISVLFSVSFYHYRINPQISYMLPVTITDAQGLAITDTINTIYFHVNGNFLSDSTGYSIRGTKTEYIGDSTTGSILDIIQSPGVKFFAAIEPEVSAVDYADLGAEGWQYLVTVDPTADTLISVAPNSIILGTNGVLPGSFVMDTATYDAAAGVFHFASRYQDMQGNLRVVNETMTKQ